MDYGKAGQTGSARVAPPFLLGNVRGVRVRFPFRIRNKKKPPSGGGGRRRGRGGGRLFKDDAVHFLFVVEDVVDPLDGTAIFSYLFRQRTKCLLVQFRCFSNKYALFDAGTGDLTGAGGGDDFDVVGEGDAEEGEFERRYAAVIIAVFRPAFEVDS